MNKSSKYVRFFNYDCEVVIQTYSQNKQLAIKLVSADNTATSALDLK